MEDPKLLTALIESGGALGAFVVGVILSMGYYLRHLSFKGSASAPPRTASETDAKTAMELTRIKDRLRDIEHDLEDRPTREEIHELRIAMTKSDGKMDNLFNMLKQTGAAVTRIEDFMISYGTTAKKDG